MSKTKLSKPFLMLFFLVSVGDIVAIYLENSFLQMICKSLIIPSLLAWYLTKSSGVNKLFVIALVFSFVGDVLLLDKVNYFIFGIGAFLITQLIYVLIFSKGLGEASGKHKLVSILPFLLFFSVLISILKPNLNELLIPVSIYGFVISVFGMVSLLKYLNEKNGYNLLLLQGAVLFIISDSMIALNKFFEEQSFYPVSIMITYIAAQYLITSHVLQNELMKDNV
ncbi:lysoplasmalogenase [Lutimonas sp.]|uniref:lysoplasmalogenase n=1 Tax=Lutimonas sp. TaxID=1872403 RepID=UPI003D9BA0A2